LRQNKDPQWTSTFSYNFTCPVSKHKVAYTLKVALMFSGDRTMQSRSLILKELGVERWKTKGHLSCLFTALNYNHVIFYDKKQKCYTKGKRYKEFLEYSLKLMNNLQTKLQHNEIYLQVIKETSNSAHFILD